LPPKSINGRWAPKSTPQIRSRRECLGGGGDLVFAGGGELADDAHGVERVQNQVARRPGPRSSVSFALPIEPEER
jgi:hypothetical protein